MATVAYHAISNIVTQQHDFKMVEGGRASGGGGGRGGGERILSRVHEV